MCRLFGFKSVLSSQVHSSLVGANNALMNQGEFHPDGWGVAYYQDDIPHLIKSPTSVINDEIFQKISAVVRSQTVIAHIRKATKGRNSVLNCHPFQYGKWTFAHNGNIKNFEKARPKILKLIDQKYLQFIIGDTDSEVFFYYLLSNIDGLQGNDVKLISHSLNEAIKKLTGIIGELAHEGEPNTENFLTFILSSEKTMIAFCGGQPMYFSSHKQKCPESKTCGFYNSSCENKVSSGKINHFIVSSEILHSENIWQKMEAMELKIVIQNGEGLEIS
jgi:glutamine amidotransferase